MERKRLRRNLSNMEKRIAAWRSKTAALVSLYATGELAEDAYITACAAFDCEFDVRNDHIAREVAHLTQLSLLEEKIE
jgi:hypothetical protein